MIIETSQQMDYRPNLAPELHLSTKANASTLSALVARARKELICSVIVASAGDNNQELVRKPGVNY